MNNKRILNSILGTILLLCAGAVLFAVFNGEISSYGIKGGEDIVYDEDILSFDANWKLSKLDNDSIEYPEDYVLNEPVEIPGNIRVRSGQVISMSNALPASVTEGSYLAFVGTDCFVTAYIDGDEIYESPKVKNGSNLTPIPGWCFIPLKNEYSARNVTLCFSYPYSYSAGMIPKIFIGTHAELLLYASYSSYVSLYIGIFIIIMGLIIFIFTIVNPSEEERFSGFTYLGIYVAAIGFILICQINMPRIEARMYYVKYMASNLLVRMLPIIHSLSIYLRAEEKKKRVFVHVFMVCLFGFIASVTLHYAGIMDLTKSLPLASLLLIIEILLSLAFDLKEKGSTPLYRILSAAGILSFSLGLIIDLLSHYVSGINGNVFKSIGSLIFAVSAAVLVIYLSYNRSLEILRQKAELTKGRINLMISQIQPHFIYNTLTAIRAMIKKDPDRAYNTIYDFAGYLRYNINALSDVEMIPFSEELKHIRVYADIEKERFRDRFSILYDIEDGDFGVPPLSVQPFVENAVKHGVCKKSSGGCVTLRAFKEKGYNIVEIEDNGVGFDTSILEGENKRSVGIRNAVYRLKAITDADVDIQSEKGKGTMVRIAFPMEGRNSVEEMSLYQ